MEYLSIKNLINYEKDYCKERVTCFFTKSNPIDDKNLLCGYPLMITKKYNKTKILIISEILSYEGYFSNLSKNISGL